MESISQKMESFFSMIREEGISDTDTAEELRVLVVEYSLFKTGSPKLSEEMEDFLHSVDQDGISELDQVEELESLIDSI